MRPLILAVPSKGRLQENAAAFFARAGLVFDASPAGRAIIAARSPACRTSRSLFLSASEIVSQLAAGAAHLGITGEDLVREQIADADEAVELLTPLGFGHANVVVAVPQAWIDVRTMADLDEVAADLRARHGTQDAGRDQIREPDPPLLRRARASPITASSRASARPKARPAPGAAELIVDITTTGATLAANALKILDDGVILRSEANLVASARRALDASARGLRPRTVLTRIAAEEEARTSREVRAALDPDRPLETCCARATVRCHPALRPARGREIVLRCRAESVFDARRGAARRRRAGHHRPRLRLRLPPDQSALTERLSRRRLRLGVSRRAPASRIVSCRASMAAGRFGRGVPLMKALRFTALLIACAVAAPRPRPREFHRRAMRQTRRTRKSRRSEVPKRRPERDKRLSDRESPGSPSALTASRSRARAADLHPRRPVTAPRGFGGCNTFRPRPIRCGSRTFAVGPFALTKKSCDKGVMAIEQAFLVALRTAANGISRPAPWSSRPRTASWFERSL